MKLLIYWPSVQRLFGSRGHGKDFSSILTKLSRYGCLAPCDTGHFYHWPYGGTTLPHSKSSAQLGRGSFWSCSYCSKNRWQLWPGEPLHISSPSCIFSWPKLLIPRSCYDWIIAMHSTEEDYLETTSGTKCSNVNNNCRIPTCLCHHCDLSCIIGKSICKWGCLLLCMKLFMTQFPDAWGTMHLSFCLAGTFW